jgi:hypothetical protein
LQLDYVGGYAADSRVIVLGSRKLEKLRRVGEADADAAERGDDRFQLLLFLAELLGALRVVPELRVFELAVQRREARLLRFEVKDTSAARPTAIAGRKGWRRSG